MLSAKSTNFSNRGPQGLNKLKLFLAIRFNFHCYLFVSSSPIDVTMSVSPRNELSEIHINIGLCKKGRTLTLWVVFSSFNYAAQVIIYSFTSTNVSSHFVTTEIMFSLRVLLFVLETVLMVLWSCFPSHFRIKWRG